MWVFSKTKLGKLVDGNKRIIGFFVWLLGYLIQGLAIAAQFFPQTTAIGELAEALKTLDEAVSDLLKSLGLAGMAVGVYHAAEKDKDNAN